VPRRQEIEEPEDPEWDKRQKMEEWLAAKARLTYANPSERPALDLEIQELYAAFLRCP
jgi:hypothetical protein